MADENKVAGAIEKENEERSAREKFETAESTKTQDTEMPAAEGEFRPENKPLESAEKTDRPAMEKNPNKLPADAVNMSDSEIERNKQKIEIEKILEKGLKKIYASLPLDQRQRFKAKGEKTASDVTHLIVSGKITPAKTIDLVKNWLLLITDANNGKITRGGIIKMAKKILKIFRVYSQPENPFIEQQTKIKTDDIIKLNDQVYKDLDKYA